MVSSAEGPKLLLLDGIRGTSCQDRRSHFSATPTSHGVRERGRKDALGRAHSSLLFTRWAEEHGIGLPGSTFGFALPRYETYDCKEINIAPATGRHYQAIERLHIYNATGDIGAVKWACTVPFTYL